MARASLFDAAVVKELPNSMGNKIFV